MEVFMGDVLKKRHMVAWHPMMMQNKNLLPFLCGTHTLILTSVPFQKRKCYFDISILYILRGVLPLDITVVMLEFTVVTVDNG